jgi:ribosomal protein S18 acetylase RimI-like enzyme
MGIAPTVYMRILEYLSQGGIKKVFLIVDHHNFSQMRTLKKVGRQKIGEITLYRFLKLRIYRLKSETPEDYARLKEIWNART